MWKVIILAPWCVFWSFVVSTSYVRPIREWWERDS